MPQTVWDQFSDPVQPAQAQSWDAFSDPVQPAPAQNGASSTFTPGASGSWDAPQSQPPQTLYGAGLVEAPMALASGIVATPIAGLAGIGQGIKNLVTNGGMPADERIAQIQNALTYQPRTVEGQVATNAIQYPFEKLAQAGDWTGQKAVDITGSPAVGAAVNTAVQAAPSLLLRGRVGRGSSSVDRPGGPVAAGEAQAAGKPAAQAGRAPGLAEVPKEPPAIEQLRAEANAAYKRAEDAGIVLSGNSVKGLKTRIVADLKKEGIDPTLHPDATAALKRVTSSRDFPSLNDLETLRKIAKDAEGSQKPADARMAGKIVDHIDDYVEQLGQKDVISGDPAAAAALKEARGYYTRLKKAEEINALIDRAKITAPNFSGSGMENALRTEFRALAKNARKMRRFSPEEQAAIRKVATGGAPLSAENIARFVGKFAPRGPVSTGFGLGAAAATGPLGLLVPAAGEIGRFAATRMTVNNANAAEALMRRGPKTAKAKNAQSETVTP